METKNCIHCGSGITDDYLPFVPVTRSNGRREDGLSTSLQLAKASEHLVCTELLMQGFNAFLADAGLPYDLVVDRGLGKFWRVQVKATCGMMPNRPAKREGTYRQTLYRFALRKSRTGDRRISLASSDYLALVALDIRAVAFIPVPLITKSDGYAPQSIELKSRRINYARGKAGADPNKYGRFIEDFRVFSPDESHTRYEVF